VEVLIAGGAEVDRLDREGWTALMHAASHNSRGTRGTIAHLVRAGAEIDRQIKGRGKTALMIAAERGNDDAVAVLLRSGAQRDIRSNGKTAADFALAGGHKRCAQKLGYVGEEASKRAD
jgi:ankyrin repeat protein